MKKFFMRCLLISGLLLSVGAQAQGFSTIRDDEIERYLQDLGRELFEKGDLEASNIKLFIVNDSDLNAFVAGGQNMFVHTGLILEDDDPNLLIGVMAHETGHIMGGHLARKSSAAETAGVQSAVGYVLGIAAVALGSPEAGMAIIGGGQQLAQSQFLKHSRAHEEAADDFAIKLLKEIEISPKGLLKLLKKLGVEMTLAYGDAIDPYRLTHPISSDRVSRIAASIADNPENDFVTSDALKMRHRRMTAKLSAFLDDPKRTISEVKETDAISLYALAIAHYRALDLEKSLELIDRLITAYPQDPYYFELKGQILFENGKVMESIAPYREANALLQDSALLKVALANSMLSSEDESLEKEAISYLEAAVLKEPKNPHIWHQLGVGYGRQGRLGVSYIALAEEASLFNKKDEARQFIKRASQYIDFSENSPAALRAGDLMKTLKLKKDMPKKQGKHVREEYNAPLRLAPM